jgi:thioredoxin 1
MIEVKNVNDFVKNIKRSKVVLVDFYADWCGPCKRLQPILEELQTEIKDFLVVKVNVENEDLNEIVVDNDISSMPTLMFYKNGEDINKKILGLQTKETLKKIILQLIEN